MRNLWIILIIIIPTVLGKASEPFKKLDVFYTFDLKEIVVKSVKETDLKLLSKLVDAENGSEQPFESNLIVAQTVINRATRKNQSIKNTIFEKNQYYAVTNRRWKSNHKIDSSIILSAEMILKGYRPAPEDIEYFTGAFDTDKKWLTKISKSKWKKIGYHTFHHRLK